MCSCRRAGAGCEMNESGGVEDGRSSDEHEKLMLCIKDWKSQRIWKVLFVYSLYSSVRCVVSGTTCAIQIRNPPHPRHNNSLCLHSRLLTTAKVRTAATRSRALEESSLSQTWPADIEASVPQDQCTMSMAPIPRGSTRHRREDPARLI